MRGKWVFLSYPLSPGLSAYRNGKRIEVDCEKRIEAGDAANNSSIAMSLHFGTHMDFPRHFFSAGETATDYEAEFFVFSEVGYAMAVPAEGCSLITAADLEAACRGMESGTECLIVETGMGRFREEERYWNDNYGFDEGTAHFLRERFPKLRVLGFDLISLSCVHHRETGRKVHREFFEAGILPLEDMNLYALEEGSYRIRKMVVSPLRIEGGEAAPATVFANIVGAE